MISCCGNADRAARAGWFLKASRRRADFGFALQTFIIVGGILRLIPLTGITLPFVSYGGSSVVANFVLLAGLLLSRTARIERGGCGVNAQVSHVGIAALVLLAALIVGTTYWQSWAGAGLANHRTTPSSSSRSSRSSAARSMPSDGRTVLATNVTKGRTGQTLYFRRYPPGRSFRCRRVLDPDPKPDRLEQSYNDYLTGRMRTSTRSFVRSRQAEANTVTGTTSS